MPGSPTTPGWPSARVGALGHIAFHYTDSVGTRDQFSIAAQWLACTFPCRRFADILADACARLGADVDRYSFIAVDLHHLLLAGLPAHPHFNGFPARLVVPGWTATYWMKHLVSIEAAAKPFDGFWMKSAYRIPNGKFRSSSASSHRRTMRRPQFPRW